MSLEVVLREMGIALHNVDDDRLPGHNVPLLGLFVELVVATYDICTETVEWSVL